MSTATLRGSFTPWQHITLVCPSDSCKSQHAQAMHLQPKKKGIHILESQPNNPDPVSPPQAFIRRKTQNHLGPAQSPVLAYCQQGSLQPRIRTIQVPFPSQTQKRMTVLPFRPFPFPSAWKHSTKHPSTHLFLLICSPKFFNTSSVRRQFFLPKRVANRRRESDFHFSIRFKIPESA